MENYQKSGRLSNISHQLHDDALPSGSVSGEGLLLVNKSISQQKNKSNNPVKSFLEYPRAVKLVRDFVGKKPVSTLSVRSEISSFTAKSKSRLKFTAGNSFPQLISQFGMTYHKSVPDGKTVKRHMNTFLTDIRRHYPDVSYLWILEFQSRGIPHFHIFLSLEHSAQLGKELGSIWHRIAEPDSKQHLKFHQHEKNFIKWDMGSGSYLCKYLDKEHQKAVPAGFSGVGRFWGNSTGLVPPPFEISADDINTAFSYETVDETTGEIVEFNACTYIVRTLCRHHEKSLKNSPWKSSARKRPTSFTLPNSAGVLRKLEAYLYADKSKILPF